MDMGVIIVWLVGLTGLIIGLFIGYLLWGPTGTEPQQIQRAMEPVTRPMQAIEQSVEEQPTQVVPALEATASWEREFDKIMDDAWKTGW